MNKAYFLDRDGTINVDAAYLGDPDRLKLLPGAAQAIRKMHAEGFLVLVMTNQSGVARGLISCGDVERVNARLNELLRAEGAFVDAFYYCPHHPEGIVPEYSVVCDCRKPKGGLYRRAIRDFELDVKECYACGDMARDLEGPLSVGVPESHCRLIEKSAPWEWFLKD